MIFYSLLVHSMFGMLINGILLAGSTGDVDAGLGNVQCNFLIVWPPLLESIWSVLGGFISTQSNAVSPLPET